MKVKLFIIGIIAILGITTPLFANNPAIRKLSCLNETRSMNLVNATENKGWTIIPWEKEFLETEQIIETINSAAILLKKDVNIIKKWEQAEYVNPEEISGIKNNDGSWNIITRISDLYDFDLEAEYLTDDNYGKITPMANNLAYLSQSIDAIENYWVTIEFNHTFYPE